MLKYVSVHALIAQSAERILGKDEVTGSNPVKSSTELNYIILLTRKSIKYGNIFEWLALVDF